MDTFIKSAQDHEKLVFFNYERPGQIQSIVFRCRPDETSFRKLRESCKFKKIQRPDKNHTYIDFDVKHVLPIFHGLSSENFTFSQDFLDIVKQIVAINKNSDHFIPTVSIKNFKLQFTNVADHTKVIVGEIFHEFYEKSPQIFAERMRRLYVEFDYDIKNSDNDLELSSKILKSKFNTLSISPTVYNFEKLWKNIEFLGQKPVVIVLDDSDCIKEKLEKIIPAMLTTVKKENISFMFRLDNKSEENIQFNQYLHQNGLDSPVNNYTEVAFITRSRISKIFLKYFPTPYTLILMTRHSFGKLKYLMQNSQVTYLYKDSIFNITGGEFEVM